MIRRLALLLILIFCTGMVTKAQQLSNQTKEKLTDYYEQQSETNNIVGSSVVNSTNLLLRTFSQKLILNKNRR